MKNYICLFHRFFLYKSWEYSYPIILKRNINYEIQLKAMSFFSLDGLVEAHVKIFVITLTNVAKSELE